MKVLMIILLFTASLVTQGQSIVGKWQLIKQSTCIEDELDEDELEEEDNELVDDMKAMSAPSTQVLQFRENNTAEENTKIINRRKSYNSRALMYKFSGTSLYILDKRSKTIIETFNVEKISPDSLIISNSARVCETKVFLKIK
jgi:hypothetical protein